MENLEILNEVKDELKRFNKKIDLAIKEQSDKNNWSKRHYAASKRASLDLKNELTKLTQDSKYKYGN